MHPRKALAQLVVCSGLLVSACGGPFRPAAAPASGPSPEPVVVRFEEGPCSFDIPAGVQADCGYVVVPEDYGRPAGPAIRLALVRFRSTDSERRLEPVIVLAGGPGEKAVENALYILEEWQPMVGERDLIIFDQRGAGLSEPALDCPELSEAQRQLLNEADPQVSSELLYQALTDCHERLESEGHNLSAYNSVQNAADVYAIRVALGYDQVNLVGGSYGTLLAQAVMRDYPAGVRSVVVSSVLPLEKSFFIDSIPAAPGAITRLLDACAADPTCATSFPDLEGMLYETVDRLNRDPVSLTLTHPETGEAYDAMLTGDAVLSNLVSLLYWTDFLPILPRAIYNVSQGDYQLMTELCSLNLVDNDSVSQGMRFSVLCAEDLVGRTEQDYADKLRQLPGPLQEDEGYESEGPYGPWALCECWQVQQVTPADKLPLASDIPTLILEGEFDPVTPPEYGELLAGHLPNSYFLTLPGVGHDVLMASDCAREVVRAFLDDPGRTPDVACVTEMPGLVFDVPGATRLTLVAFEDAQRGIKGLAPDGWTELAPGYLLRLSSPSDPTTLVLDSLRGRAADFMTGFTQALGLDSGVRAKRRAKVGVLTWSFYEFDPEGGYPVDLALAERSGQCYIVAMTSAHDERAVLYERLFMPAVEAMAPL